MENALSFQILFGKAINENCVKRGYQNFQSNGFCPFHSKKEALTARKNILKNLKLEIKNGYVAKIKMEIAEKFEELQFFRNKTSLVAITTSEEYKEIYGPKTKNVPSSDNTSISNNGLKCFNSYQEAYWRAKELKRQAGVSATIAHLIIKKT